MSKTIKQIADELGVSKTAVRKKITEEIKNKFSETNGNTVYIDEQGESLIKSAFSNSKGNLVSGNETETVSELVSMLKKELEMKNNQITALNERLAESSKALVSAQQSAETAQALHAGTIKKQLEDGENEENKKKWQFWKK